ncbi:hypothetical protein LR48_Vigan05g096400 [Vigna angularis]|nr:hypothetical protein LR48_Vigan05g096400 [Vigna angularis]BAT72598.1 hypothetical protein VIGAN_01001900 [Vigna angularis var. angularis]
MEWSHRRKIYLQTLKEIESEDDLFSTYIHVEKLDDGANDAGHGGNGSDQSVYGNGVGTSRHNDNEKCWRAIEVRLRHQHSTSVDGSSSTSMFGEIMEANVGGLASLGFRWRRLRWRPES